MKLQRRFQSPFWIAVAASVVAFVLAVFSGGPYDPSLAVLTFTLIAVIWYTYFTFLAVHREESAYVTTGCYYERGGWVLKPTVSHPTRRRVNVTLALDVWIDRNRWTLDEFWQGKDVLQLGQHGRFVGHLKLPFHPDEYGHPTETEVLVRFVAHWHDDLDESGMSVARYWRLEVGKSEFYSVVGKAEIGRFFDGLQFTPNPPDPEKP